jgi:hypothetical protein
MAQDPKRSPSPQTVFHASSQGAVVAANAAEAAAAVEPGSAGRGACLNEMSKDNTSKGVTTKMP